MNNLKKIISLVIVVAFLVSFGGVYANDNTDLRFSDIPRGHWAEKSIYELRSLKITDGIGENRFGLGLTINRSEFVAFLVKLMKWELIYPGKGSFADNMDKSKWYYPYIETALEHGVILNYAENFRPVEPITREEMAIMIVRTLGYDSLSNQLACLSNPFEDIEQNTGYITIAKDFGIINGVGNNLFKPYDEAKREEAAAMMMRMYEKLNQPIDKLHGFYAIRSAHQAEMIESLSSVGFGWSRLEYDFESKKVVLNTSRKNNNEYAIPAGFSQPMNMARESRVDAMLMVFAKNDMIFGNENETPISLVEYVVAKPEVRKEVIKTIAEQINATVAEGVSAAFDGVVIDFENMRGESLKKSFNEFLAELKEELMKNNKQLYVAVHPARKPGQAYYDGYDYKTIGSIADKVILMAHDYYAKQLTDAEMEMGYTTTPLTPIDEIYWALKAITDKDTGMENLDKILVQLSFDSVQWKLKDGKVINKYPYNPDYETIRERLLMEDVAINYSKLFENPYAFFYDGKDETQNIIWYEDSRSIKAKLDLMKMFGIKGVSIWRLGNIPSYEDMGAKKIYLNIWQQILGSNEK